MKYLHPRSMYTLPRGGVQKGGVTPCFPQFVIIHKIGIIMLMHEDNVNVLLFELPMDDCGSEALKVLAMISLEEECENYK